MTHSTALRPAWTPLTIFLMVLGFIVFWPLGLAMLAYILWGDRLPEFRRNLHEFKSDFAKNCGPGWDRSERWGGHSYSASGNAAFDEYRAREMKRLEEERRRLDEERREFSAFMRNLRAARDKEEFDRFMQERHNRTSEGPTNV